MWDRRLSYATPMDGVYLCGAATHPGGSPAPRVNNYVRYGSSPRGAQALYRATQALALVEGREYAIPDDVKRLVSPVFAHRVMLSHRAAAGQRSQDGAERVLQEILTFVEVPL